MEKLIKVNYNNVVTKEFPINSTLESIASSFQSYYNYPILAAKVDNDICGLHETINKKCDVDFYDISSYVGNGVN